MIGSRLLPRLSLLALAAAALSLSLVGASCGGTTVVEGNGDGTGQGHNGGPDRVPDPVRAHNVDEVFTQTAALWQGGPANYERVESMLEDAVDDYPEVPETWFNLGVVREALGDEGGAIEAYRQSNAADPQFVDGLSNIAAIMLDEGRDAEARQLIEQVITVDQFHPGANLNLARIHRARVTSNGSIDTAEADEAINKIRLSLAGDAMNVAAYETLAGVYYDLGRFSLAQLVCNTAIALDLESPALYNRYGLILLAMDDVTGAYAQFRRASSLNEAFTEASMNLGAVALSYRDYAGAQAAFDTVLRYDPDNLEAMLSRAVALRGLDDLAGAEQGYQAVLEHDGDNLAALYNMGVLYQEYHLDYATALEWFQRYLRVDSGRRSELASDVETRVDLLRQLIELIESEGGGAPPEPEPEPEPGATPDPL